MHSHSFRRRLWCREINPSLLFLWKTNCDLRSSTLLYALHIMDSRLSSASEAALEPYNARTWEFIFIRLAPYNSIQYILALQSLYHSMAGAVYGLLFDRIWAGFRLEWSNNLYFWKHLTLCSLPTGLSWLAGYSYMWEKYLSNMSNVYTCWFSRWQWMEGINREFLRGILLQWTCRLGRVATALPMLPNPVIVLTGQRQGFEITCVSGCGGSVVPIMSDIPISVLETKWIRSRRRWIQFYEGESSWVWLDFGARGSWSPYGDHGDQLSSRLVAFIDWWSSRKLSSHIFRSDLLRVSSRIVDFIDWLIDWVPINWVLMSFVRIFAASILIRPFVDLQ